MVVCGDLDTDLEKQIIESSLQILFYISSTIAYLCTIDFGICNLTLGAVYFVQG